MRVFLRTFNRNINSKTGASLPPGQYRGTPEWMEFQRILIECIKELTDDYVFHEEYPFTEDGAPYNNEDIHIWKKSGFKTIMVHQTKREFPSADLFWMQMHMRELFTIDTNGWGADHSDNSFKLGEMNSNESKLFCEEKSRQLLASKISKCDQPESTGSTPPEFILVPMQIPRDYTIKHHSPITVRYFVDSIMAWAEETKTHVCIKMHTHNKADYDLQIAVDEGQATSPYVHKVEGNIHELIKRSKGIFVINSGTGFESLIHGRPVCTFGNCDYNRVTFNADLRRIGEAREFIDNYKDEWKQIGYEFVYWYYTRHGYDVTREDTKRRLMQYLREVL